MIHTIENEYLKVSVKEFGAELTSLFNKTNNTEYLWQGNPDVWAGQSPVLFPIIGRLRDDKYTVGGKEYSMPKHGLARKRPFVLSDKTDSSMTFTQIQNEETLKQYPFDFVLELKFIIEDKKLTVQHTVKNVNDGKMYFSVGAHPAFNCKIGDKLIFEKKETLSTQMLDLKESLRLNVKESVLDNDDTIIITENIFDKDALIFDGIKSSYITLYADNGTRPIKFGFDSPYLGIWAKPGAEYVCLEPWYGVNDAEDSDQIFEKKEGIITLEKGEAFIGLWTAEL